MLSPQWQSVRELFDSWLQNWLFNHRPHSGVPGRGVEMMKYCLHGGGKAFRPTCHLLMLDSLGQPMVHGKLSALALECIHTYSLVHDDLPCMDDDDWRRGRPSAHRKFGEANAVLIGDSLLTLAFELMGELPAHVCGPMTSELARSAGYAGMVAGQCLDMELMKQGGDLALLEELHRRKTGALIAACFTMAGIRAQVSKEEIELLRQFGLILGLAFQVRDDILDVTVQQHELGKSAGKDQSQGKLTFPALLGVSKSQAYLEEKLAEGRSLLTAWPKAVKTFDPVWDFLATRKN